MTSGVGGEAGDPSLPTDLSLSGKLPPLLSRWSSQLVPHCKQGRAGQGRAHV